jgi:hypothetical protein
MPGGAIRNAIFRRSAASAPSGVESSPKAAERDCFFTPPENHGIYERKLEISLLHTEMFRSNVERSDAGVLIIIESEFSNGLQMVRDTGFEPVTPTVSR